LLFVFEEKAHQDRQDTEQQDFLGHEKRRRGKGNNVPNYSS